MIDRLICFGLGVLVGFSFCLLMIYWLFLRSEKRHDPPTKEEWKVM